MKRLILIVGMFIAAAFPARAQFFPPPDVQWVTTAPSGACRVGAVPLNVVVSTLNTYGCAGASIGAVGAWTELPSGGGGTGSVVSVAGSGPSWLTWTVATPTTTATITLAPTTGETSHQVIGTCGTATTFAPCALVAADIPALSYLVPSNNLSDVSSAGTSRTNLGLGTAATQSIATFLQTANNLSDLASASAARSNLGLGSAALVSSTCSGDLTGTLPGCTVAAAAITLAKMANLAANSFIGNNTASPATPIALTEAQAAAMLIGQTLFTLTTTGTSGAATYSGGTLNIPQYSGGGGSSIFTSYQFNTSTALTATGLYIQTTYPSALLSTAQTGAGTSGSPYVDAITLASQSNATFFGNVSGGSAAPSFNSLPTTNNCVWKGNANGSPSCSSLTDTGTALSTSDTSFSTGGATAPSAPSGTNSCNYAMNSTNYLAWCTPTTWGQTLALTLNNAVPSANQFMLFGAPSSNLSTGTWTSYTISTIGGLGTGVGTFLGAPTWTNFSSMITGTAPYPGISGSPAQYEVAVWGSATAVGGIGPGASNAPLLGGGGSANPAFSSILYLTSLTSGGTVCGTSATQLASSGLLATNALMIGGGAGACPSTTTTGAGILTALASAPSGSGAICLASGSACAAAAGGGIVTYSGPSLTVTGTLYFPIGGGGASSGTETNVDVEAPSAATITNFYVQLSGALTTGNAVFTWRKNAAATAVTCTITSGTSCSDTTHSFTVVQGDLIDIQIVASGSSVGLTLVMATQFGSTGSNGTVNTGTQGQWGYYAAGGTAVSGAGPGTAKQMGISNGTSGPAFIDFPHVMDIPAANCNSATPGAGWSLPASSAPTAACRAATNNLGGTLNFADAANAQFDLEIPGDADLTSGNYPYIKLFFTDGANTSGTEIFQAQVSCYVSDFSATDDVAFAAAQVFTTRTATAANRSGSENLQFNSTSMSGCVAGASMIVKITRNTDTAASVVPVSKATITIPRLLTQQAN